MSVVTGCASGAALYDVMVLPRIEVAWHYPDLVSGKTTPRSYQQGWIVCPNLSFGQGCAFTESGFYLGKARNYCLPDFAQSNEIDLVTALTKVSFMRVKLVDQSFP